MGKQLNLDWVGTVIGENYKNWNKGDIVKISAQTGTGKTFFITGDKDIPGLIDYAESKNEHVLYLCNRTNLKKQIKLALLKKYNLGIPYIYDGEKPALDEKGRPIIDENALNKIFQIKNITISSYHSLQNKKIEAEYFFQEFNLDNYEWIIADEIHFVLADASFCNTTRFTYDALFKEHNSRRRTIFISATMDWIDPLINEMEGKEIGINKRPKIHSYTTGIDYSYVNAKYFKEDDDIITTINNDESGDKWLVFVSNLDTARKLQEQIRDSRIVTATESDQQTKTNIIQHSSFECRVVIATKAIDNGVNFADEKLTNIVIYAWDKITFIQELGRKRVDIHNAQEINLYIKHRWGKAIRSKLAEIAKKESMLELYNKNPNEFNKEYENSHSKVPQELFYIDCIGEDSAFFINKMGEINLNKMKEEFEKVLLDFEFDKEHAFICQQLEWIGLQETFNEENYIENVVSTEEIETLENFIESLIGCKVLDDNQIKLKEMLTSKAYMIDRSLLQGTKRMHPDTANSILEKTLKLPYKITPTTTSKRVDGKPKKYTYWTVIKTKEL